MKKTYLILPLLLILMQFTTKAQTIPNAGFESWGPGTAFITSLPTGWKTTEFFPGVNKDSTSPHSGNAAMKLSVAAYFTGVGSDHISTTFGTPVSQNIPAYFTLWAKVHLKGIDKLYASTDFVYPGSTLQVGTLSYGSSAIDSSSNTNVYRLFAFPINNSSNAVYNRYDTIYIGFYINPGTDTGSYVIIDDLAYDNNANGINEQSASSTQHLYPSPANQIETFIYTINGAANVTINVVDVTGKTIEAVVAEKQQAGTYKANINTSAYANGMYFIVSNINGQATCNKFIVQH